VPGRCALGVIVEIEVDTLAELEVVLAERPDSSCWTT